MSPQDQKRIKQLMNLADAAADFEFVDPKLVFHFHAMREDLGLAKLLLMIQDYAELKHQNKTTTEIPQVSQQNQNTTSVP
jgi:hypothetical protein